MKKKFLPLAYVMREVEGIRLDGNADPEATHSHVDDLRVLVLREIANGNPMGIKMAKEVLKIEKFNLTMWYS